MTYQTRRLIPRLLLATALGLGGAGIDAHAASGYDITTDQQAEIKPGMGRDEVLQRLGKPAIERSYRNQSGPTWIYRLLTFGHRTVHVDFDANGRVQSVSEHTDYDGDR